MTQHKTVLFFDTETTGLLPNKMCASDIHHYPYILQLAFILLDVETRQTIQTYNQYIKISEDVVISQYVQEVIGITHDTCKDGVDIVDALHAFNTAYNCCDAIVGHNISFDINMIEIEMFRNRQTMVGSWDGFMFNTFFHIMQQKTKYCTMQMGKPVCNIMMPSKIPSRPYFVKQPKLEELYTHLFQSKMINAHDAYYDTLACMECFLKMQGTDGSPHPSLT